MVEKKKPRLRLDLHESEGELWGKAPWEGKQKRAGGKFSSNIEKGESALAGEERAKGAKYQVQVGLVKKDNRSRGTTVRWVAYSKEAARKFRGGGGSILISQEGPPRHTASRPRKQKNRRANP